MQEAVFILSALYHVFVLFIYIYPELLYRSSLGSQNSISFQIPAVLKDILVDDQDMINRQMYLSRLPARFTVTEIIRQVLLVVGFFAGLYFLKSYVSRSS